MLSRPPTPISFGDSRYIHSAFPPEVQNILERSDGECGIRGPRQAEHLWRDIADRASVAPQVMPKVLPGTVRLALEPLASSRVVMGAREHYGVGVVVLRTVWIIRIVIEGELENPCTGKLELIAKGIDIRSNDAKVFHDER